MQSEAVRGAHSCRMEWMSEVAAMRSFDRNGKCGMNYHAAEACSLIENPPALLEVLLYLVASRRQPHPFHPIRGHAQQGVFIRRTT